MISNFVGNAQSIYIFLWDWLYKPLHKKRGISPFSPRQVIKSQSEQGHFIPVNTSCVSLAMITRFWPWINVTSHQPVAADPFVLWFCTKSHIIVWPECLRKPAVLGLNASKNLHWRWQWDATLSSKSLSISLHCPAFPSSALGASICYTSFCAIPLKHVGLSRSKITGNIQHLCMNTIWISISHLIRVLPSSMWNS